MFNFYLPVKLVVHSSSWKGSNTGGKIMHMFMIHMWSHLKFFLVHKVILCNIICNHLGRSKSNAICYMCKMHYCLFCLRNWMTLIQYYSSHCRTIFIYDLHVIYNSDAKSVGCNIFCASVNIQYHVHIKD